MPSPRLEYVFSTFKYVFCPCLEYVLQIGVRHHKKCVSSTNIIASNPITVRGPKTHFVNVSLPHFGQTIVHIMGFRGHIQGRNERNTAASGNSTPDIGVLWDAATFVRVLLGPKVNPLTIGRLKTKECAIENCTQACEKRANKSTVKTLL